MSRMNDPMNPQEGSASEQVRQHAGEAVQNVREMGSQVREAAREKLENLRDQASEYYDQGREKAQEWEQNLESYIQDQPVKSLLIAAGVGFLLGVIWKRS